MPPRAAVSKKVPLALLILAAVVLIVLVAAVIYLNRPVSRSSSSAEALPESKAYVSNLQLSDVTMSATENFMKQQVVEIQGKIANKGDRELEIGRRLLPLLRCPGPRSSSRAGTDGEGPGRASEPE